jgi:hypothetical protein
MSLESKTRSQLYNLVKSNPKYDNEHIEWKTSTKVQLVEKLEQLRDRELATFNYTNSQKKYKNYREFTRDKKKRRQTQLRVSSIVRSKVLETMEQLTQAPYNYQLVKNCHCQNSFPWSFAKHNIDECIGYRLHFNSYWGEGEAVIVRMIHSDAREGHKRYVLAKFMVASQDRFKKPVLHQDHFRLPHILQIPDAFAQYRVNSKNKYAEALYQCAQLNDTVPTILQYL